VTSTIISVIIKYGVVMKIFYSWQSDIDENINRYFIFNALEEAKKLLEKEVSFNIEIDQATRNEPGTPAIPETIFKKIDDSSIFIADITLINEKSVQKRTPNPNVLIELGYAIKKHSFDKIILIFNSEFGTPEEFPFDIKHRRLTQYKYNSGMDKKDTLKRLTSVLMNAILLIDKKTMTKEKINIFFYNKDEDKQYGENLSINDVIYQKLTENDFLEGINFNEISELKQKMKLTEWQEYLFKEKKEIMERRVKFDKSTGMPFIVEHTVKDPYETKDYYIKYMAASLIQLNKYKLEFLIKNNNEQTMKNVKIILKTEKKNRIYRAKDIPNLPPCSTLTPLAYGIPQNTEPLFFQKKEYGDYTTFEYEKDNIYSDEEYILEEPLYISLKRQEVIKIEYTIYCDNLSGIKGILVVNMNNELRDLTPMEVFLKL